MLPGLAGRAAVVTGASRAGALAAVGAAIAGCPPLLAAHAVLGRLLLVAAISFLVRAIATRRGAAIALGVVGLLAMLAAVGSGAGFVASGADQASMSMAVAAGVAMLAYAAALLP
jgi:hypothetical protein